MTTKNLTEEIRSYVADADAIVLPQLPKGDPLGAFPALKRTPLTGSRYNGRSIFEVANRTLSDLVVLGLAERLLREGLPGHTPAVERVRVLLGTEDNGNDGSAQRADGRELCAECFKVAPSFFQTKLQKSTRKLRAALAGSLRAIAYNADAAPHWEPKVQDMVHVAIDVDAFLVRHRQRLNTSVAT